MTSEASKHTATRKLIRVQNSNNCQRDVLQFIISELTHWHSSSGTQRTHLQKINQAKNTSRNKRQLKTYLSFIYTYERERGGDMERHNKRVYILRKRRRVHVFCLIFMRIFPRRESRSFNWFVEFCQGLMRQNFPPLGYYYFRVKKK